MLNILKIKIDTYRLISLDYGRDYNTITLKYIIGDKWNHSEEDRVFTATQASFIKIGTRHPKLRSRMEEETEKF